MVSPGVEYRAELGQYGIRATNDSAVILYSKTSLPQWREGMKQLRNSFQGHWQITEVFLICGVSAACISCLPVLLSPLYTVCSGKNVAVSISKSSRISPATS